MYAYFLLLTKSNFNPQLGSPPNNKDPILTPFDILQIWQQQSNDEVTNASFYFTNSIEVIPSVCACFTFKCNFIMSSSNYERWFNYVINAPYYYNFYNGMNILHYDDFNAYEL